MRRDEQNENTFKISLIFQKLQNWFENLKKNLINHKKIYVHIKHTTNRSKHTLNIEHIKIYSKNLELKGSIGKWTQDSKKLMLKVQTQR